MNAIHTIVSKSLGAYTHDDVFELEAGLVKHLELMFYEQDSYQSRLTDARNQQNQTGQ